MKTKRIISVIFTVIVSVLSFALPAGASWYDEVSGGTYKTISGSLFVADTFYGVDALYSENSKVYQCNELVNRFYEQAYGIDIFAGGQYGILSFDDNYTFKKLSLTDTPKTGDIIYASSENRNGNGVHWALVKSYKNGVITMFEQNVVWQGKAGIDRKLKWPGDGKGYTVYTPVGKNGHSDPVLKQANITSDTTAATNYTYPKEVVESLNGKTTTAAKPETSATTTTKPTTTKPTTTEPATTKPTTEKTDKTSAASKTEKDTTKNSTSSTTGVSKSTAKSTTAKTVTTKKVTTTKQKSTESTTVITTSEETTEFTAVLTTVSETRVYTESEIEEVETNSADESENTTARTVLICAVAAVACLTAGAVVVLIKKKRK